MVDKGQLPAMRPEPVEGHILSEVEGRLLNARASVCAKGSILGGIHHSTEALFFQEETTFLACKTRRPRKTFEL